jgi:alkylhydroperoxidase family enzyme
MGNKQNKKGSIKKEHLLMGKVNPKSPEGPPAVYMTYPHIYGHWSHMSEALMNGRSPLSRAERELIFAYAAGLARCEFIYVAHSEVAYALGVERGLIDKLLCGVFDDVFLAPRQNALLGYVRKLVEQPTKLSQADADLIFASGWNEQALHDAIAVTARAAFMQTLAEGYRFTPMTREQAAERAERRVKQGYVDLYRIPK